MKMSKKIFALCVFVAALAASCSNMMEELKPKASGPAIFPLSIKDGPTFSDGLVTIVVNGEIPDSPKPKMTYKLPDPIRRIAMNTQFNEFDLNLFFSAESLYQKSRQRERGSSGAPFPRPVSAGVFMMIPPGISHMPRRAVSLSGFPDAAFGVTDGGYARARREARSRGSDSILHHKHRQPRQCTV